MLFGAKMRFNNLLETTFCFFISVFLLGFFSIIRKNKILYKDIKEKIKNFGNLRNNISIDNVNDFSNLIFYILEIYVLIELNVSR